MGKLGWLARPFKKEIFKKLSFLRVGWLYLFTFLVRCNARTFWNFFFPIRCKVKEVGTKLRHVELYFDWIAISHDLKFTENLIVILTRVHCHYNIEDLSFSWTCLLASMTSTATPFSSSLCCSYEIFQFRPSLFPILLVHKFLDNFLEAALNC